MMRRRLTKPRRGVSLPELLIALVVLGIIGAASVRVLLSQTHYYDVQLKKRAARSVSRASVNLMLSELRMMESAAGVEAVIGILKRELEMAMMLSGCATLASVDRTILAGACQRT